MSARQTTTGELWPVHVYAVCLSTVCGESVKQDTIAGSEETFRAYPGEDRCPACARIIRESEEAIAAMDGLVLTPSAPSSTPPQTPPK